MENSDPNMTINVSIDDVLKKVYLNSFYRGERLKDSDNTAAARMQSGSDDKDILTDELELAITDVVSIMNRFLGNFVFTKVENGFSITGRHSVLFPLEDIKATVQASIEAYCVHKVLEGWLLINQPGEVINIGAKVAECAEKLRILFCKRTKPV